LKQFHFILLFSALWFCTSCNSHKNDIALAKVGDAYLYQSDILGLVAPETSSVDSATIVKNYIDVWVSQQLLAQKAADELPNDKKDFDKQLENYKQLLMIQAFETYYLDQHLDTMVKDNEIKAYYDAHLADFELKSNIVRLNFVKFRKAHPSIPRVKQLLFAQSQNKRMLAQIADKSAENYFLDDNSWLLFDDIVKELPIQLYQPAQLLQNRNIEIQDSLYHFLIVIKDFKIKDDVSPLIFERENIKAVILNSRRNQLLEKLRLDVKKKAVENSDYEIFQK